MLKKLKALQLAPWWKRLCAYFVDQIFLFIFLIIFITGLYGDELKELLNQITLTTEIQLLAQEYLPNTVKDVLAQLPLDQQKSMVFFYQIQSTYSRSIYYLSQILSGLYFFIFWVGTGQTLGARLFKIRVISFKGTNPEFFPTFMRVISLKLIEFGWGLPALIMINPMFKQRMHDHISQTIVVDDFNIEQLIKELQEELQNESKHSEN